MGPSSGRGDIIGVWVEVEKRVPWEDRALGRLGKKCFKARNSPWVSSASMRLSKRCKVCTGFTNEVMNLVRAMEMRDMPRARLVCGCCLSSVGPPRRWGLCNAGSSTSQPAFLGSALFPWWLHLSTVGASRASPVLRVSEKNP